MMMDKKDNDDHWESICGSDPRYEARRTRASHASLNLQFDDDDVDHEAIDDLEDADDDDPQAYSIFT